MNLVAARDAVHRHLVLLAAFSRPRVDLLMPRPLHQQIQLLVPLIQLSDGRFDDRLFGSDRVQLLLVALLRDALRQIPLAQPLRENVEDARGGHANAAAVRTVLRLRPGGVHAVRPDAVVVALELGVDELLGAGRSSTALRTRGSLRVQAYATLAAMLPARLARQAAVALAAARRRACYALPTPVLRLSGLLLVLLSFQLLLPLGLLLHLQLLCLLLLRRDARHCHRHGAEDRLETRILLLAALAVVVLDVLRLFLGYVDAIAVVPLLAGVAAAIVAMKLLISFVSSGKRLQLTS